MPICYKCGEYYLPTALLLHECNEKPLSITERVLLKNMLDISQPSGYCVDPIKPIFQKSVFSANSPAVVLSTFYHPPVRSLPNEAQGGAGVDFFAMRGITPSI